MSSLLVLGLGLAPVWNKAVGWTSWRVSGTRRADVAAPGTRAVHKVSKQLYQLSS